MPHKPSFSELHYVYSSLFPCIPTERERESCTFLAQQPGIVSPVGSSSGHRPLFGRIVQSRGCIHVSQPPQIKHANIGLILRLD